MTTLIGIAILVGIFVLDSLNIVGTPIFFNIALAIVSFMMMREFYNAVEKKGVKPLKYLGYLSVFTIIPIGFIEQDKIAFIYFLIFPILLFIGFLESIYTNIKVNIIDIAVTILGALYTMFLPSFMAQTRAIENGGVWYIWFIFGSAWFTDIFAFLIGKFFGKHKLKKISTNKSWEGCVAGLLGGTIFFMVFANILNTMPNIQITEFNLIYMGILGLVVSLISQIGDLSASSIKRYCGIKDFSDLMPGHGGMLDRFDSILFVAPVVYFALSIML